MKKLYAVEAISTFRLVYFVECKEAGHAEDTVAIFEAKDPIQTHLGEMVVSSREVNEKDVLELLRQTEQPDITGEKFKSGGWMKRLVHSVEYDK